MKAIISLSILILFISCNKSELTTPIECCSNELNSTLEERAAIGQIINPIVKDCDGNIYHVVKIGTQVWM
ncbi:MAG: hypothetical protein IPO69_22210 [Saprospiraceae bacterium]|nr:hypothetical protein [Saprospiraceae bacterium]